MKINKHGSLKNSLFFGVLYFLTKFYAASKGGPGETVNPASPGRNGFGSSIAAYAW